MVTDQHTLGKLYDFKLDIGLSTVEKTNLSSLISIYPNPVNKVDLHLEDTSSTDLDIKIFNLQGKKSSY